MQYGNDRKRALMLRDVLLNYPFEPAPNAPPPPDGITDDEQALEQFYSDFEARNPEQSLEGNYPNAENGQPAAQMSPGAPHDFELMQRLQMLMPKAGQIAPVPEGGPTRARALAQMLRNRDGN